MPRALFGARLPNGSRLGGPAKALCAFLWGYVVAKVKMAQPGPHFVYHDQKRLSEAMDLGERAIVDQLAQLRELGAVTTGVLDGRWGYFLFTPAGYEDRDQPADAYAADPEAARQPNRALGDRVQPGRSAIDRVEIGDRPRGRSAIDRVEIGDRSRGRSAIDRVEIGDRSRGRSAIDRVGPKEEQKHEQNYEQQLTTAAAAGELGRDPGEAAAAFSLTSRSDLARQLLAELARAFTATDATGIPVPSQQLLASDAHTVGLVTRLLAVPAGLVADDLAVAQAERVRHVREVSLRFAAVCATTPAQVQFWGPTMFRTEQVAGRMSRWEAVKKTVERAQHDEAARTAQARAEQDRQARARAEAEALRREVAEAPRAQTDALASAAASGSRWAAEQLEHNRLAAERAEASARRQQLALAPRINLTHLSRAQLIEMRDRLDPQIAEAAKTRPEVALGLSQARLECVRRIAELDAPRSEFKSLGDLNPFAPRSTP